MALYCCWLSYFPEDLDNFLIFSRRLCSYIELLLNDWSTPMVTICCFSHSGWKNPLIITHLCAKKCISIIKSIYLVNGSDLEHYASWAVFPSIWKQIYYFQVKGSSDLAYEFCSCVDIAVNIMLTKYGPWCSDTVIVYSGSLKLLVIVIT